MGIVGYLVGMTLTLSGYLFAFIETHQADVGVPPPASPLNLYLRWGEERLYLILAVVVFTVAGWVVLGVGARMYAGARSFRESAGAIFGAAGFCGGIALVVLAFLTAAHFFGIGQTVDMPPANDALGWALIGILRLLLLLVLAFNGAVVAGGGVKMFLAAAASGG